MCCLQCQVPTENTAAHLWKRDSSGPRDFRHQYLRNKCLIKHMLREEHITYIYWPQTQRKWNGMGYNQ